MIDIIFINNDFLPFKSGIENKVPTILVSHNIINCIDNSYPASLSFKVISELRNTLDFSGIVMTDDLAMDAVKSYVVDGKAATLAINAGNDLIITSDFVNMYNEVLTAVNNGEISLDRINDSVKRILAWKIAYNM
jgi:beta-N-acetylhexosaminidase